MLLQAEKNFRAYIRASDAPFLGLLGEAFTPQIRTVLEISVLSNPTVEGYVECLHRYPALYAVNLTSHIMQGMGQDGHFDLYPHVRRAIGKEDDLTPAERESLWRAFRRAILTLGFEVSPRVSGPHYMAEEYLRQVGVPLEYADNLAGRMLTFARRVGLPEEDDPEAVISWQTSLEARLALPFSITARRAVARDAQGYYTRAFLRVHQSRQQASDIPNALARAMARAFDEQPGSGAFKRAVLPYVALNDQTLGIVVPGGDDREFELREDGRTQIFRAGAELRFIPLSGALPKEVAILELNGHQASTTKLWEDGRNNRFLVFAENGRFRSSAQLNQPTPLVLVPGPYSCIGRFAPAGVATEQVNEEPDLYAFLLSVRPGQALVLENGPAKILVEGQSQPYATWNAVMRTTKEGVDFSLGQLSLDVEFPADWLAVSGSDFVLRLSARAVGGELITPFRLDETGGARIDLAVEMERAQWKPGFVRLLAEITRPGESRVLLRTAHFYWLGLRTIRAGLLFECGATPINLVSSLCENATVVGTLIKPASIISKAVRLSFRLDENRHQTLTWNVPGVYIETETVIDGGAVQRLDRPIGSTEVVSYTSSKQVLVSASDPGEIRLGDWAQSVDFSRVQTKRLPASLLASRLTSKSSELRYWNAQTNNEITLLRLAQPHYARTLLSKVHDGQLVVRIGMPEEPEAVQVRGQNVMSGESFDVVLEANTGIYTAHGTGRAQLITEKIAADSFAAFVYFNLEQMPSGAWAFTFDGRIQGRWGHLENERQDQFAVGLLWGDEGLVRSSQSLHLGLAELSMDQVLGILKRAQELMRTCYATEAWASLQWLSEIWRASVIRWRGKEVEAVAALVELAVIRPPEDAAPSWMLQQTVGATLPGLFALSSGAYAGVPATAATLSATLRAIAELETQYPRVFPNLIHSAFAFGFANRMAIMRGEVPKTFSMAHYCETLRSMGLSMEEAFRLDDSGFRPSAGDWLGPLHYKFALRQLEAAYDRSRGGNDIRKGQALGLARQIRQSMPFVDHENHEQLRGVRPHLVPWPYEDVEAVPDEVAQRRENLEQVSHFLSLLAYRCRLAAKGGGGLQAFLSKLEDGNRSIEGCLAYLLQVGEAVFAFYLLLWEAIIVAEGINGEK